ncbi:MULTISPECIES: hypothetical protein [Bacteria]
MTTSQNATQSAPLQTLRPVSDEQNLLAANTQDAATSCCGGGCCS